MDGDKRLPENVPADVPESVVEDRRCIRYTTYHLSDFAEHTRST